MADTLEPVVIVHGGAGAISESRVEPKVTTFYESKIDYSIAKA